MKDALRCAATILIAMILSPMAFASQTPLELWYDKPATQWVEALPIGNGRLGAMVFGRTERERIQFNDDTLFTGAPHDYAHRGAVKHLPELRRLLFAGQQGAAHALAGREFMSVNLHGRNTQEAYQPFGDLTLEFPGHEQAIGYRRALDLDQAITTVEYQVNGTTYRRQAFASFPAGVIVVRLAADKPGALTCTANFTCPHRDTKIEPQGNDRLVMRGQVERGKMRFEAQLLVRHSGGQVRATKTGIEISSADQATILLAGASSFVNYQDISGDPTARNEQTLQAIGDTPYEALLAAHVADYQKLFQRCTLDLGETEQAKLPTDQRLKPFGPNDPQLATLVFQYGRYLMIASSRPGAQPANLQGLWNESKNPPWDSKYTININAEMNYWLAELTGLAECHRPLFAALQELSQSGQSVAKEHYGAPGWVAHHNFDLWRGAAPINASNHGIWPTGGAWLCQHLWWHYEFGGDRQFLAEIAYPIMKGAALFFLDYLVEDPQGEQNPKWLVSGPSNSPERGGLVMGPTMDHQIIRALFQNTAAAAKALGVDEPLQQQLLDTVGRIAPNQIGSLGQLKEWFYKEAPKTTHRHVSHLWGLHPGREIHPRTTPELAEACRVTLRYRGDGGTGWAKAWKINFWARLLDGDHAYKMLGEALRASTYPNLFCAHPPFQIDGNFGATSGMVEMLLQSHLGEIDLLPALPQALPYGKVTGLRARGGFEVDITWREGQLTEATIRSHLGNPVTLRSGEQTFAVALAAGEAVRFDGTKLEKLP